MDGSFLQGSLVCLVVEPAVPLGRNHAGVVIHSVLGVVDDPPVTTIEILIVLVVFVPVLILSNKLATLLRGSDFILSYDDSVLRQTLRSSVQYIW